MFAFLVYAPAGPARRHPRDPGRLRPGRRGPRHRPRLRLPDAHGFRQAGHPRVRLLHRPHRSGRAGEDRPRPCPSSIPGWTPSPPGSRASCP
ncbi:MAG: hypothetical protein MZV64_63705 [Ignavibacteriales bacterium]|nr:hypothetical protein [Ignavibacteriales bacterium]